MPITTKQAVIMALIMLCSGLGGVLYGYDIGVISGALVFMQKTITLSTSQQELIVGAVLGGGLVGTLLTGSIADRYGRRTAILIACLIFALGTALILMAHGFEALFIARLLLGIGVGVIAVAVPLYLSEIVPPNLRGRGITLFQIFLTAGIMLAYLVDLLFTPSENWHAMFALLYIPSGILFLSMLILPETPRWLLANKQEQKARTVLHTIMPAEQAQKEIELINKGLTHTSSDWRQLFSRQFMTPLLIALFIAISNQLTGINVLFQYAPKVMDMTGMPSHAASMLATLGIGCVNFITTLVAMLLIDRIGRKYLLTLGTAGLILANLFLACCSTFFHPDTVQAYFMLAGFLIYTASFAIGPGVVVWLAISELLPTRVRGKAISLCLFVNSLTATILSSTFLSMLNHIGMSLTYCFFAFCCFLYFLIAKYGLPETKGRTLEDIQAEFEEAVEVQ